MTEFPKKRKRSSANRFFKTVIVLGSILTNSAAAADLASIKARLERADLQTVKSMDKELSSLTKSEKDELLKALSAGLKSSDWQKQEKAAHMAGALGPDALPLLPLLISAMNAQMSNVAWEAAPAIGKIGKPALPALIASLKKEQLNSRLAYNLIKAIGAMGPNAQAAVPALSPFLADGANTGAVEALKKIGPSATGPLALSLEAAKDSRVWVYSREVFSAFPAQAANAFAELLKNRSDTSLKPATYVLSEIAGPAYSACIPGLIEALLQNKAEISDNAQEALIKIGPAASAALKKHALDDDIEIQRRVAAVLQKIAKSTKTDLAYMQKGLSNKNPEAAALTASTILKNEKNNPAALATLIGMLNSPDESRRRTACRACTSVGGNASGTVSKLTALLKDPNPGVRMEAAAALGSIGPEAASATQALIEAATSKHPVIVQAHEAMGMDGSIQQEAIEALGKIGPKAAAAVPTLTGMLANKENSYRYEYLLKALQGMKSAAAPALPSLVKAWQDKVFSKALLLETFKSIGPQATKVIPMLSKSLEDPQSSYRKETFETVLFLETDQEKKRAFVSKFLNSPDYELSRAASSAYASLGPGKKAGADLAVLLAGLNSNQYDIKLNSIKSLGNVGPAAQEALPVLIKENIGCSYSQDQKSLAFEAIKKIDPSGEKVIPLLKKALEDPFQVRGACELLEFIGSPKTKPIAAATRAKWKL